MANTDPFDAYQSADPDFRQVIKQELKRQNQHQWFYDGMQLLGMVLGAGLAVFALVLSYNLIEGGNGGQIAAGAFIGGGEVVALAGTFAYAHHKRAVNSGP
ncbi:hypothetical protein HND25_19755 [Rhodococcus erythropolis]|uniref:hypothetical protein n=1 Tax=Rhodococcus erythropolis TaxID=1833 RepID=UPI000463F76C|nr:hypothetical protein [Rhodococcus erythropolis]MBO8148245.1 hypothetical protein [Rhodococcus erythropolis]MDO1490841.1 hypothetical protein [Rhodococcus erythropolis]GCB57333.1 hypothetical protein rerp_37410 [Rhodococcus erythropolis]